MLKSSYGRFLGATALLLGFILALGYLYGIYQIQKEQNETLKRELREAQEISKEAVITRRISSQLEEIAYQQKEISDIQRQEAVHQSEIAENMRRNAEYERENALLSQEAAIEAYSEMEAQKQLADQHREEAVAAQMKADTLARLALVRSLGAEALSQYEAENKDLAALLCYSAWKFSYENKGDIYQPALFNALSLISDLYQSNNLHKGAIRAMKLLGDAGQPSLLTASQDGELFLWKVQPDGLDRDAILLHDNRFDFRFIARETKSNVCWALTYKGDLLKIDLAQKHCEETLETTLTAPAGFEAKNGNLWIMTKEGKLFKIDPQKASSNLVYSHDKKVSTFLNTPRYGFLIGDQSGQVYQIGENGEAKLLYSGHKQEISCLNGDLEGSLFIGYKNGLIQEVQIENQTTRDLVSHVSSPTSMILFDNRLLSVSMDGSARLWNMEEGRIVSSEIYNSSSWIHSSVLWNDGLTVIVGDEKGACTLFSISPERMAKDIKQHLSRDFTREEWQYYIGELAEYETYK